MNVYLPDTDIISETRRPERIDANAAICARLHIIPLTRNIGDFSATGMRLSNPSLPRTFPQGTPCNHKKSASPPSPPSSSAP